jgi:hypothetical protein
MRHLLLVGLAAISLVACEGDGTEDANTDQGDGAYITFYHDDERDVSCWVYDEGYGGGISCIPDDQLNVGER